MTIERGKLSRCELHSTAKGLCMIVINVDWVTRPKHHADEHRYCVTFISLTWTFRIVSRSQTSATNWGCGLRYYNICDTSLNKGKSLCTDILRNWGVVMTQLRAGRSYDRLMGPNNLRG